MVARKSYKIRAYNIYVFNEEGVNGTSICFSLVNPLYTWVSFLGWFYLGFYQFFSSNLFILLLCTNREWQYIIEIVRYANI